jgi:hypothetical protein
MYNAKELINLAEECFRRADHQDNSVAEALRQRGLRHLEDAYAVWSKPVGCIQQLNAVFKEEPPSPPVRMLQP